MSIEKLNLNGSILELNIPNGYEKLSDDEIKNYPAQDKPSYIFKNNEKNYTAAVFEKKIESDENYDLDTVLNSFYFAYQRTVPGFSKPSMGKKIINGNYFGALQYCSTTLTEDHFNMVFVTVKNKVEIVVVMKSLLKDVILSHGEFMDIINSAAVSFAEAAV